MPIDAAFLTLVVAAAITGYLAGGLVHALAARLPAGQAALGPPVCASCTGETARGYAWLILPGACLRCAPAERRAALATQLAGALLSALALLRFGPSRDAVVVMLFSLLLLVILRIDWEHHLIFTITIVPGVVLALLLAAFESPATLLSAALAGIGAAVVFGLFFLLGLMLYRRAALGAGDILLAGLIGTMTGVRGVVPALFLGMATAAGIGIVLVALRRKGRMDYIPYGAYLCGGTIVALFLWGPAG